MSKHDDWFDDYMIMQMMEEDERRDSGSPSSGGSDSGCLPTVLVVIGFLWVLLKLIG